MILPLHHNEGATQKILRKKMKALITATAPTVYQLKSLRAFKLDNHNKNPSGGERVGYTDFDSVKEAREYLTTLAFDYYDGDKKAINWHLGKNSLSLDACTASIITGEERREFLESSNRKY